LQQMAAVAAQNNNSRASSTHSSAVTAASGHAAAAPCRGSPRDRQPRPRPFPSGANGACLHTSRVIKRPGSNRVRLSESRSSACDLVSAVSANPRPGADARESRACHCASPPPILAEIGHATWQSWDHRPNILASFPANGPTNNWTAPYPLRSSTCRTERTACVNLLYRTSDANAGISFVAEIEPITRRRAAGCLFHRLFSTGSCRGSRHDPRLRRRLLRG
jgi:hypothetical protein